MTEAVQGVAAVSIAARAGRMVAEDLEKGKVLFVGTQTGAPSTSEGIYAYRWDAGTGSLTSLGLAAKTPTPSFLALSPDGRFLVAANETEDFVPSTAGAGGKGPGKTGGVSSFRVDGSRLTFINSVAAEGPGTCHVSVDHTGGAVFVANYTGGSASSFQLGADGRLSAAISHFHYQGHGPNADRQEAPHAHRTTVSPENKFVFINDLGLDCVHIYHLDATTAKLTASDPAQWSAAPGSGPRALRFHPSGRWAYCVNELTSVVDVLGWDAATGRFTPVQKLEMLPGDFKGTARASEIVFERGGQFAYAAVRDNDFLATMVVHEGTGKLTLMDRGSCGGKTPRHIALDPSERWLLVANQDSDVISVFPRDAKTGKLGAAGPSTGLAKPQCLVFA